MNIEYGDIWTNWSHSDLFLIETHSTLNVYGNYLMGARSAQEAGNRFPGLGDGIAKIISGLEVKFDNGDRGTTYHDYGLLVSSLWPKRKMGLFQIRADRSNSINPLVAEMSTHSLMEWCKSNDHPRVDMPMVGWGTSMDNRFLELLPDSVNCWLPESERPRSLSIPAGHALYPAMSMLDGDFLAHGFRLHGPRFEQALYSLYNAVHLTRNGRLLQFISAEAYIANGGNVQGAIHVGRSTFGQLERKYPNIADGE